MSRQLVAVIFGAALFGVGAVALILAVLSEVRRRRRERARRRWRT